MLEVVEAGLFTTVQDGGRAGHEPLGVPPGGACDPWSLAVANLLLGNPPDAPALEATLLGPTLLAREEIVVALAGADMEATVVEEGRAVAPGTSVRLRVGRQLRLGPSDDGARAYLTVPGGFDVPRVLGSASTHVAAGFGGLEGRPLRPGDRLRAAGPPDAPPAGRSWPDGGLLAGKPGVLRIVPTGAAALDGLLAASWTADPRSDRVGLRLDGPPLDAPDDGSAVSTPMAWGAVQLPPGGRPIVLLADQGTVGGYPVVGVVIRADRPLLGQLGPGDAVRFEAVSVEEAQQAWREQQARLAHLAARIEDGPSD